MTQIPFTEYDMSEHDFEKVVDIYNHLKTSCAVEPDYEFEFNFKKFHAFQLNEINSWGPVIKFVNNKKPFYLTFPEVTYNIPRGRYSASGSHEFQIWGVLELPKKYGHTLIKRENLLDKIYELINPIELDFEDDKHFSRNYYVVTNDRIKAELMLTTSFRKIIQEIEDKDFIVEILDNWLIVGNKKTIDLNTALNFASFLSSISKQF